MKRYIANSFSPEDNPTDAARAVVETLNSDITKLHNIVAKYKRQIKLHPDDDSRMNKLVDDLSFMQNKIDEILDNYR